jgi:hypothetical protein
MDAERITFVGKMAFGKPPGRCIYCGSDGGNRGDEHIVAYCLAIDAYLPKASCQDCAAKTSYLEGYAGRQIFGPLRVHFQIQSRRKKIKLNPVEVTFKTGHGRETTRLVAREAPSYGYASFARPTRPLSSEPSSPYKKLRYVDVDS